MCHTEKAVEVSECLRIFQPFRNFGRLLKLFNVCVVRHPFILLWNAFVKVVNDFLYVFANYCFFNSHQ